MATAVFTDITFWEDNSTNRAIAVSYTGLGTPTNSAHLIDIGDDSGTTPGVLYADSPLTAKLRVPGAKVLMRVASLLVSSSVRQYPKVKNYRTGNTNNQSALTKTAFGVNQLALTASTDPSGDVDTLIVPTPSSIPFLISKLNFSQCAPPASSNPGFWTQYYYEDPSNPTNNGYRVPPYPLPGSLDSYDTYWFWPDTDPPGQGSFADDSLAFVAGASGSLPTYIWFELTPQTALVGNVRYRLTWSNELEVVNVTLNTAAPAY